MRSHTVRGGVHERRCLRAPSASAAEAMVRLGLHGPATLQVYRVRLRRLRRLELVTYGGAPGSGDGGDGAGVREPRRPKPGPGQLSAELDLPA